TMSGTATRGRRGKLKVLARGLSPGKTFTISVAGVHIGTLKTNSAGTGKAGFSNPQRGHAQLLGVDPSGHLLQVSEHQGDEVMEGDSPDASTAPGDTQCWGRDDEGTECEEPAPADGTAANGTNMGAGSCFPNPCPTTPPSGDIVCCVPNA